MIAPSAPIRKLRLAHFPSSARMAIEPAVAGYTSGQLPLVSVIEAVQALWLVQADLIAADTELGLAWARLGRAVGSYEGILR